MPRTILAPVIVAGAFDATPCSPLVWTPADVVNGNRFAINGTQICLARNTDAGAQTITVTSVPDEFGRTQHLTAHSIAADAIHCLSRFPAAGWRQSDGFLYISASDVAVEFCVIDLVGQVSSAR